MDEDGERLRFGLLCNAFMICDSSFDELVTGLILIVALGSLNE
jgi:hypothetical protein